MLEVLSAVTGESIAVFEDEEIADGLSSKGIKTALGGEDWPPTIPTTAPPRQLPTG